MTCQELVTFLMEYLSGSLSAEERTTFEEHLAECPDCVAYLATYQQTIALGKTACREAEESMAGHVPEELVQAILATRRSLTNVTAGPNERVEAIQVNHRT